ncbi:MAG: tRNA lysidine(34) synthetase TilS, partial [Bacteroidota bacterium]
DRMKPLGMSGSKKISDILNDLKVSPAKKSGMLVLADSKGIFSLKGYRISDKVKLAKDSTRVLKIVYEGI